MSSTDKPDTSGGVKYRVCWNASSNITFQGHTDWVSWDDDDDEAVAEEVERELCTGNFPAGLSEALEASGFDWWVETR